MKLLPFAAMLATLFAACGADGGRSARPDIAPAGRAVSRDAGVLNHGTGDMNSGGFQDPYGTLPPPTAPR